MNKKDNDDNNKRKKKEKCENSYKIKEFDCNIKKIVNVEK